MSIGSVIAYHRKRLGMTQETLAQRLDLSNQAVSKWESGQSLPDILLLPRLADLFDISMDELFERKQPSANSAGLPWENDDALRIVLFHGHRPVERHSMAKHCTVKFEGEAKDVHCSLNLSCGDVSGAVTADGFVECGNVVGDMKAGSFVECGDVQGNVIAGAYVECGNVGGNLMAGSYVDCGNIGGNATSGAYIECDEIFNR